MLWHKTTKTRALANPAAKLFKFGRRDGRYKKPDPDEWGGIMNMSYLPGGRLELFVGRGVLPWGGGGGG